MVDFINDSDDILFMIDFKNMAYRFSFFQFKYVLIFHDILVFFSSLQLLFCNISS